MIRNVVVGRLKDGVAPGEVEPALQALRDLKVDGVEFTLVGGVDLGLRDGAASFALTWGRSASRWSLFGGAGAIVEPTSVELV